MINLVNFLITFSSVNMNNEVGPLFGGPWSFAPPILSAEWYENSRPIWRLFEVWPASAASFAAANLKLISLICQFSIERVICFNKNRRKKILNYFVYEFHFDRKSNSNVPSSTWNCWIHIVFFNTHKDSLYFRWNFLFFFCPKIIVIYRENKRRKHNIEQIALEKFLGKLNLQTSILHMLWLSHSLSRKKYLKTFIVPLIFRLRSKSCAFHTFPF